MLRQGGFKESDLPRLSSVHAPNGVATAFRDFAAQADFDKHMPLPDPSLAAHRREVQAAMVDKMRQRLLRHG